MLRGKNNNCHALTSARRIALYAEFENDLTDHMPIWVRLPVWIALGWEFARRRRPTALGPSSDRAIASLECHVNALATLAFQARHFGAPVYVVHGVDE